MDDGAGTIGDALGVLVAKDARALSLNVFSACRHLGSLSGVAVMGSFAEETSIVGECSSGEEDKVGVPAAVLTVPGSSHRSLKDFSMGGNLGTLEGTLALATRWRTFPGNASPTGVDAFEEPHGVVALELPNEDDESSS